MTARIEQFLNACHEAGIHRPELLIEQKMQALTYGWMKGCFPRGIMPTDIDCLVEVGGRFLVIDFKNESQLRGDVPTISQGQLQAYKRLVQSSPVTLKLVGLNNYGYPCVMVSMNKDGTFQKPVAVTIETLRNEFSRWSGVTTKEP